MVQINDIMKKASLVGISCCFFCIIFAMPLVFAQSTIPITKSDFMDRVVFDGRWTFTQEWKPSSDEIIRDSTIIHIRTAHQDNFIYVMLDAVTHTTIDNNKDFAMVCFDTKSDQSVKPDANYYCFKLYLGSDKAFTFQGTDQLGELKSVDNHVDLIAVAAASDENDRYSSVPHGGYEYRIPIELLGRTDHYGFYVEVFDFTDSITYTWPSEINLESNFEIPSPTKWGLIYSPDKSLPEYDVPMLVLVIGIFSIILLSIRSRGYNLLKIQN